MNRRPRNLRRVCIAVMLGACTTIVISWLAMFLPWDDQRRWQGPPLVEEIGRRTRSDGLKTFQITRGSNAWHAVTSYWWMQVSGRSLLMSNDPSHPEIELTALEWHMRPDSIDDIKMLSWYHATGWPMHAMTCSVHWENQILNSNIIYSVRGGMQLPRDAEFNPRALPLTPLWPGFAVNVLLHAGAWWLLMWCVSALRRRHRMMYDHCLRCGYSRRGLPRASACPECGDAPQR